MPGDGLGSVGVNALLVVELDDGALDLVTADLERLGRCEAGQIDCAVHLNDDSEEAPRFDRSVIVGTDGNGAFEEGTGYRLVVLGEAAAEETSENSEADRLCPWNWGPA